MVTRLEGAYWIHVAQDRNSRLVPVNGIMDLIYYEEVTDSDSWVSSSFSISNDFPFKRRQKCQARS